MLQGNQISTLPDEPGMLSALTELDLRFNALETLPEALAGMTGLRFLDLRAIS